MTELTNGAMDMTPKRIQRKRTKGWRMPENSVYVGRPTKWGNKFSVAQHGRDDAIRLYREWLATSSLDVSELAGKDLACWCKLDSACHADILLAAANSST